MKNLLRIFNPFNIVTVCRAIGDARAEQAAYELLQQEDALMAQRLKQHRLATRQRETREAMRKVAKELKLVMTNPDNIIQGPDEGKLDWCLNVLNVLNNPEE
jgi:hypothetical protein